MTLRKTPSIETLGFALMDEAQEMMLSGDVHKALEYLGLNMNDLRLNFSAIVPIVGCVNEM